PTAPRNLPWPAPLRERLDEDLAPDRRVGTVGQPAVVWRQGGRRRAEWKWVAAEPPRFRISRERGAPETSVRGVDEPESALEIGQLHHLNGRDIHVEAPGGSRAVGIPEHQREAVLVRAVQDP